MLDILRDDIWKFVGVVVSCAGILLTVILFLIGRTRKRLSCEVLLCSPISPMLQSAGGSLQLVFDGRVVDDVTLFLIKIANDGSATIRPEDFQVPLRLGFGKGAQVLAVDLIDADPHDLLEEVAASKDGPRVVLKPTLLNSGNSCVLRVLATAAYDELSVGGHVAGIKSIRLVGGTAVIDDLVEEVVLVVALTVAYLSLSLIGGPAVLLDMFGIASNWDSSSLMWVSLAAIFCAVIVRRWRAEFRSRMLLQRLSHTPNGAPAGAP